MTSLEKIEALLRARANREAIRAFTHEEPQFSLEDGYVIQNTLLEKALAAGESLSGYKMGLTSKAKQKDVNVFEPIHGFLLRSMEISPNGKVSLATRIQPRVEPEIAIVVKDRLDGKNLNLRDLPAHLSGIYLACEIIDSRYKDYQFKLPDVIADNTSASGYLLGRVNLLPHLEDLRLLGITMRKNGEVIETGAPAAALGDPLNSLLELARTMASRKEALLPGQVILTGGLTNSHFIRTGDHFEVECPFERFGFSVE